MPMVDRVQSCFCEYSSRVLLGHGRGEARQGKERDREREREKERMGKGEKDQRRENCTDVRGAK